MTSPRVLTAGAVAIVLCALVLGSTSGSQAQEPEGNYGVGVPSVFLPKYLAYRAGQLAGGAPDLMRIRLGYVKGASTSFTSMVGEMAVNLQSGAFTANLSKLAPFQTYSVWLVDRSESEGVPDAVFGLASFLATGTSAVVTGVLGLNEPLGFTIDRVVVAPGLALAGGAQGVGTVNVFQKIFFRRLSLVNESTGGVLFQETTPAPRLSALVPDLAAETDALLPLMNPLPGQLLPAFGVAASHRESTASAAVSGGGSVKLDTLISQGAELFFEETFRGNGRTCGTCHPASNNFTIDPAFIATLPPNDPLFVANFNPALEQLEQPALLKDFGLILENLDGLEDPKNKFVMRGVPHTLGLQVSLTQDPTQTQGDPPAPPVEMTGWSGDGAPGTGSLREFAIGAVTQHFTKRLDRIAGTDFKLPTEHQLDAMEAFQLSLGRNTDFSLSAITFNDDNVQAGKNLFVSTNASGGSCAFCHNNAGALTTGSLQNRNFDTNVEVRPHPGRNGTVNFPFDGGFGKTPTNPDGTFGNFAFNTPPVVEAADTPPFFHNNVVDTLEDVIDFYTVQFSPPFIFNPLERTQVVAFMRGINTLQNIDVARRELEEILANNGNPVKETATRLQTAFDETQDAIDVVHEGNLLPDPETTLIAARDLIAQAQGTNDPNQRRALIQQAIAKLVEGRDIIAT